MIVASSRLLTAEEFSRRSGPLDGSKEELVRGKVVMTPPPGFMHGYTQVGIGGTLRDFVRRHQLGRVTVETGLVTGRDPDSVRGPGIAFWSKERLPFEIEPAVYPDVAADLCVEILSPDERRTALKQKISEYFERGVRLVWVVDPRAKTIAVYRSSEVFEILAATDVVDGGETLPGFRSTVSDLLS